MNLTRPLVCLDIESTGVDPAVDRIVTLAMKKLHPDSTKLDCEPWYRVFDPGVTMTPDNIAIHGITNEEAQLHDPFSESAAEVLKFIAGCDILGFNVLGFDVQILMEEVLRAGLDWSLDGVHIVDAFAIFRTKEPRDLSAARVFYCGKEHPQAHNAMADVEATLDVLAGQLHAYPDLGEMDVAKLSEFCRTEKDGSRRLDLAGTVVIDKNGVARFTHKKVRGVAVKDDLGYLDWILRTAFPADTHRCLTKLRDEIYASEQLPPMT